MRDVLRAGGIALVGVLLGFASAQAQEPPAKSVNLRLSIEQAMLVTQVLGQIDCHTVTQMMVCNQAIDLLKTIRDQVKAQGG